MSIFDADPTLHPDNPNDPEGLVLVAAGELPEWSWLVHQLADWLDTAAETTVVDFHRRFGGRPTHRAATTVQFCCPPPFRTHVCHCSGRRVR